MSNVQIPNLGAAIALNGSEQLEAVQAGTSVRVTTQQISNFTRGSLDTVAAGKVLGRDTASGTGPVQELPIAVDASGNVGIGTSSPLGSAGFGWLTLNGTGGSITSYVANGTETLRVQAEPGFVDLNVRTNVPFIFKTSDTERMRIDAAGNVGIGTSSPDTKLFVLSAVSQITATDGTVSQAVGYANTTLAYSGTYTNHPFAFLTNATEKMRIDTNGNVGIGTSSPGGDATNRVVTIAGSTTSAYYAGSGAVTALFASSSGSGASFLGSSPNNPFYFVTNSTERMRIEASGNVGIGTSAPFGYGAGYTSVAVNGSTSGLIDWLANGVRYGTAYNIGAGFAIGNATANPVYFLVNNVERMRIGGDGKVAIGTATPDASAILDVTSTAGGVLFPRMTGTQRDAIGSPANGLVLYNTTTNKLQVRAAGAWVDLH
jgi:hypothetical protein